MGHGRRDAIRFGDEWIGAPDLAAAFTPANGGFPRTFISLCCATGRADFARAFSRSGVCAELIAPYGEAHGAIAATFTHAYFTHHFLQGRTQKRAFNLTRRGISGGAIFRFWQDGRLKAGGD
jgi:hypothetical protein